MERANHYIHPEIPGVHVELFVGRKGEAQILPGGEDDLANNDVSGGVDLQSGRDQKLRLWLARVDMESIGYAERQGNSLRLALHNGHQWRWSQGDGWPCWAGHVLREGAGRQKYE